MRFNRVAGLKALAPRRDRSFCHLPFALCLLVCSLVRRQLSVVHYRLANVVHASVCHLPFALCLLVCFSSSSAAPPFQAGEGVKPPPPQDSVLRSVVQLIAIGPAEHEQNRECSATGFLINEGGFLLTNAHVVEDAKRCLEKAPGARILAKLAVTDSRTAKAVRCDVVGLDEVHDLAILKTERPLFAGPGNSLPYAALDPRDALDGTDIIVSGHPGFYWQPVTSVGHVVRQRHVHLDGNDAAASDALEIDLRLRVGNSGSPVYRPGGGVIAVVDQRDALQPSHTVVVSIRYAIALAERLGVTWHGVD